MKRRIYGQSVIAIFALFTLAVFEVHSSAQQPPTPEEKLKEAENHLNEVEKKVKEALDKANAPGGPAAGLLDPDKKDVADQQKNLDDKQKALVLKKINPGRLLPGGDQPIKDAEADVKEAEGKLEDAQERLRDAKMQILKQRFPGLYQQYQDAINEREDAQKRRDKAKEDQSKKGTTGQSTSPNLGALLSDNKVRVETSGTGETIGHIADLKIENLTDQPLKFAVAPMILESGSGRNQHYACPKGQTVGLHPRETKKIPVDGICIARNKPPVGKGVTGDLVINEGDPTLPPDPKSHIKPKDANKLLRLCTSKYDAADKLLKDGALKDIPYADPKKKKDIVVQWSTWTDPQISELTGAPPATKEDLKKVVYKQVEEQGPVTPDRKKKIDQGIDTIFEKVELTTAKAKGLEKPDPFATVELTGEQAKGGTQTGGAINTGNDTNSPATGGDSQTPTSTTGTVTNPDGSTNKTITNKEPDGTTKTTTITTRKETHDDGSTTTIEKTVSPGGETREKTTDFDKNGKPTRNRQDETDKHGRKIVEYREDLDLSDPNRKTIKGGFKKVTVYYPDKDNAPGGLKTERTENLGPDGRVVSGTEITVDPNGQTKTTPLP